MMLNVIIFFYLISSNIPNFYLYYYSNISDLYFDFLMPKMITNFLNQMTNYLQMKNYLN